MPYNETRDRGRTSRRSSNIFTRSIHSDGLTASRCSRVTLEDIYSHAPPTAKLVLLVIENRDDFTGRQVSHSLTHSHIESAVLGHAGLFEILRTADHLPYDGRWETMASVSAEHHRLTRATDHSSEQHN